MPDFSKQSDVELVTSSLKEPENFGYLIDRYELKLLRYIHRLTGLDSAAAEDILQEVFIKAYRNLFSFDSNLSFSSWIYRITHNESISFLRQNKKHQSISLEADRLDSRNLLDQLKLDYNVAEEAAKNELAAKVRQIIWQLPDKYKDVLILRYLEDKNYEEISDIIKKPVGTVSALINRAKVQFKNLAERNNLN